MTPEQDEAIRKAVVYVLQLADIDARKMLGIMFTEALQKALRQDGLAIGPAADLALAAAVRRLQEAMPRFDRHGRWRDAMFTIRPTYGGGWSVEIEYPEADYGNHLGWGHGDTMAEAVEAALADADKTVAADDEDSDR